MGSTIGSGDVDATEAASGGLAGTGSGRPKPEDGHSALSAQPRDAGRLVLVAIGANLPGLDGTPALGTCRAAARALDGLCGLRLVGVSRWWASAPVPPLPGAPPYVNGVARLEGAADPQAVLAALHAIEDRFGRVRPFPDAPRTLDLDLIDAGGRLVDGPGLVLPHPRAHLRAFVLRPIAEVAPGWVHPRLGLPIAAMLAAVATQEAWPLSHQGD